MITHHNYRIRRIAKGPELYEAFQIEEQPCGIRWWNKKEFKGEWSSHITVPSWGVMGQVNMPTLHSTQEEADRILGIIIACREQKIVKLIETEAT